MPLQPVAQPLLRINLRRLIVLVAFASAVISLAVTGLGFGLFNTPWGLVLSYTIFTLPFTVWVLTTFMRDLPVEIEEAAIVDGASGEACATLWIQCSLTRRIAATARPPITSTRQSNPGPSSATDRTITLRPTRTST